MPHGRANQNLKVSSVVLKGCTVLTVGLVLNCIGYEVMSDLKKKGLP